MTTIFATPTFTWSSSRYTFVQLMKYVPGNFAGSLVDNCQWHAVKMMADSKLLVISLFIKLTLVRLSCNFGLQFPFRAHRLFTQNGLLGYQHNFLLTRVQILINPKMCAYIFIMNLCNLCLALIYCCIYHIYTYIHKYIGVS